MATTAPLRTICVQPTLASYRVPVYRELAARPSIDLRLWYGNHSTLRNAEPEGFAAELKPLKAWRLRGQEALWHAAQLEAAGCNDVDVLILSWGARYLSLGPALRRAKRRGLPVVLWGHGYSKNDSGLRRWMRDRIARLATVLLFYDERTAAAAIQSGWPADRVFVAPNAIDQTPILAQRDAWLADSEALSRFRREQDLIDRRLLLYVSRFTPENRLELLVDAVDRLRHQQPETLAVMIGGGEEQQRIVQLVQRRKLESFFRFLGPIYDEAKLAPWFLSAEAFVYPAAIGLSLLHAFGYGLPVVTDDNVQGQNPEIIAFQPNTDAPDPNGLAYRAGDAADFATTLDRLLNDATLQNRLASGARRTIEQRYNVPRMVDGMAAAIEACRR
ncbi:glycosyltransferase family 4 protein [Botrimarina hoheduenensis]|uniref:GDP-mannose-dependent alpha-(1-6)-phosphatidylinositol monomannoside mannosyltransferase n=1 Tax=Botrimarina hoheduenensis TaxID=2528000 RepID=A0A5C5W9S9_9BACT|nr:glycosyltransferase family 4 protein [Botrimarina hoheduenensis]TWT47364.1 GDP-mannose-dependent alpha-(1-6)-phosphatidylinositol monomannoside mannosyltransferase [Botrimarina hoheduenensis]